MISGRHFSVILYCFLLFTSDINILPCRVVNCLSAFSISYLKSGCKFSFAAAVHKICNTLQCITYKLRKKTGLFAFCFFIALFSRRIGFQNFKGGMDRTNPAQRITKKAPYGLRESASGCRRRGSCEVPAGEAAVSVLGMDYSVPEFYADSGGSKPEFTKAFRKSQKRLAKLQSHLSQKEKGSHNRWKAKLQVQKPAPWAVRHGCGFWHIPPTAAV